MRRRSPIKSSSSESPSDESDYTGSADNGVESDTDLSDADADAIADKSDGDEAWLSPNEDQIGRASCRERVSRLV